MKVLSFKWISSLSFVVLLTTSCGMSPSLHHVYPNRQISSLTLGLQTASITPGSAEGCALFFKTQNLCANLGFVTEPTHDAEGKFRLYFFNHDQGLAQQPLFEDPDAASIHVKLWMPDMGHGSGLVEVSKAKDEQGELLDGIFEATHVYFVMPGKWDIIVELRDAQGNVTDVSKTNYQAN